MLKKVCEVPEDWSCTLELLVFWLPATIEERRTGDWLEGGRELPLLVAPPLEAFRAVELKGVELVVGD